MNPIELVLNQHNAKLHPEVPELVKSLGLSSHTSNQGVLSSLSRNKQLLLVAEYHHFIQIRDALALIAPQDPATWPQQFDALAKAQWGQTVGTALEYFENPESLGYSLLFAAAAVIFPSLTPEQCRDKLVRGWDWGIREWVKLRQVNEGHASPTIQRMNCHAELVVELSTGLTDWQGVVTDGTRALNAADLLESFAPHLPHPLAQRLLQEFISELKRQYPALYGALCNYNAETRGLLSYLDQSQTPREALEELRKVFFADAKLLTGNMFASERSHQATAVFSAYLASVAPSEREVLYKLKSGNITLKDIIEGIDQGMCVELAAGEITKLLSDPASVVILNRVPQRAGASATTAPAWVMTKEGLSLRRGLLQHEIPLSLMRSVLKNLHTKVSNNSGIWLASLMNLVRPREHEQLIRQVLSKLPAKHICAFLSKMQLPKQTFILEVMDTWKSGNPFVQISEFAQLVYEFQGTKSGLPKYLPKTMANMQWSIKDLLEIMRTGFEVEIKIILQPVAKAVTAHLQKMLPAQTWSEERDLFLARENAGSAWKLLLMLPPENTLELVKAYVMPALGTGQLGIIMKDLDNSSLVNFFGIVNTYQAWNDKITHQFEEFASCLMESLTPEGQMALCDQLATHSKRTLLAAIDNTANVTTLCTNLESRGLHAAVSLIRGLVKQNFLVKKHFRNYVSKLDENDLHELVATHEAALTSLMVKDSQWLAAVIEELPSALAKAMWDNVSMQDDIKRDLNLSTINKLYVILPREEFESLFSELTENILESFAESDPSHLAQFACHALRHEQGLSLWLILQLAAIGTSVERMHNLLIMLLFLARHVGETSLPDDKQLLEEYQFMHRGALYSDYFNLLREQGHEGALIQLRNQLAMQIRTIHDVVYVQIRCNAEDTSAILAQCLPRLANQRLGAGDFTKLVGGAQPETIQMVWHTLQYQPMLSIINLVDLRVLAGAFPVEALQALCDSLRERVAEMVSDIVSFHFVLRNLPDAKQQILLEWALDVIRPMIIRPMQQTHLLFYLSNSMKEQWQPRLPILKSAQPQQSLFRVPASVTSNSDVTATPSHSK